MSYKGVYRVKNPNKYRGDPTRVIYRSSWELKLMNYLDAHPDVLEWNSEELVIPYRSPVDGKVHRYFPDFWVKRRSRTGELEQVIIEVKPRAQCLPPNPRIRKTRKFLKEAATYAVNQAKWEAAESYCNGRGWKFLVLTEKELNT